MFIYTMGNVAVRLVLCVRVCVCVCASEEQKKMNPNSFPLKLFNKALQYYLTKTSKGSSAICNWISENLR